MNYVFLVLTKHIPSHSVVLLLIMKICLLTGLYFLWPMNWGIS